MLKLPRFVKRFFRKHTRPKIAQEALLTRSKISLVYAFITWNLLGYAVYKLYTSDLFFAKDVRHVSDGRYFATILGKEDVVLKRYRGFTKVGEWDLREEKRVHGKLLSDEELNELKEEQRRQQLEERQQRELLGDDSEQQE